MLLSVFMSILRGPDKSPKCELCFEGRNTTDKLNLEAGKSKPTPMCEIGIEDHRTLLGLT